MNPTRLNDVTKYFLKSFRVELTNWIWINSGRFFLPLPLFCFRVASSQRVLYPHDILSKHAQKIWITDKKNTWKFKCEKKWNLEQKYAILFFLRTITHTFSLFHTSNENRPCSIFSNLTRFLVRRILYWKIYFSFLKNNYNWYRKSIASKTMREMSKWRQASADSTEIYHWAWVSFKVHLLPFYWL